MDSVAAGADAESLGALSDTKNPVPGAPSPVRIQAPAPGTIVALDPDIPPQHQRLQFAATPGAPAGLRWRIDGKPLARGAQAAWLPWPGRHRVELLDARGQVQAQIAIEVRGAGVK